MHNGTSHCLISIKPRHVSNIFSGRKTIEFRKRSLSLDKGAQLWIYSTMPDAKILGVVTVESVEKGSPNCIWEKYGSHSAICRTEFDRYFEGSDHAVAIKIKDPTLLAQTLGLKTLQKRISDFRPPRSWYKIHSEHPLLNLLIRVSQRESRQKKARFKPLERATGL